MTRDEVKALVITGLTNIQAESGHPATSIDGATRPLNDLPEFDSNNGIEFTCQMEKTIAHDIPLDENLCFDDSLNQTRNVNQIVDRVIQILTATTGK